MKELPLLLLISCSALAQSSRIKVELQCKPKSDDVVGRQVCTALRDIVATSPRYIETSENSRGYQAIIVSVADGDNAATAMSMVVLLNSRYLSNEVQTCGVNRVDKCARDLYSSIDDDISAP